MATVNIPYTFSNGAPIVAAEHNANWQTMEAFVNGLSSGSNFDAGAIDTVNIADASITSAKLVSNLTLTAPNIGAATGTSLTTTGAVISHTPINGQLASYSLQLSDDGKMVEISSSSAVNLTVPPDSSVNFTIGTSITILQTGAGQITVVEGSGVTINRNPGLKIRAQWCAATLIKRSANTWVLIGDLAA